MPKFNVCPLSIRHVTHYWYVKNSVLRDVLPCCLAEGYQFVASIFSGKEPATKMKAAPSSETLVPIYEITRRHMRESSNHRSSGLVFWRKCVLNISYLYVYYCSVSVYIPVFFSLCTLLFSSSSILLFSFLCVLLFLTFVYKCKNHCHWVQIQLQ
jgi:hypothetical protein